MLPLSYERKVADMFFPEILNYQNVWYLFDTPLYLEKRRRICCGLAWALMNAVLNILVPSRQSTPRTAELQRPCIMEPLTLLVIKPLK
jgi:hypothetical protein